MLYNLCIRIIPFRGFIDPLWQISFTKPHISFERFQARTNKERPTERGNFTFCFADLIFRNIDNALRMCQEAA